MADQTAMNNGRRPNEFAGRAAVRNLGSVGHNILTLAELQFQLLAADARETGRRAALPIALLFGAAVVALGCVPVLVLALAAALEHAGLSSPLAILFSALLGLAAAASLGWLGWSRLRGSLAALDRSKVELTRNLRWIKNALASRGEDSPPGCR